MLILVDKKTPDEAKRILSESGKLIEFETTGITYDAISGHPDIFFFKSGSKIITAPNLPAVYYNILNENGIEFTTGKLCVANSYPDSAHYNAAVSENYFIHNTDITDPVILSCIENKQVIKVRQGYCRCSLIPLENNSFITCDQGIYKKLSQHSLNVIYISPDSVKLPGFAHGFLGGTAGVYKDKLYLTGSLKYLPEREKFLEFTDELGYEIVELYDGPLFDCGSILFIE